jgi:hypothetical protein
MIMRQAASENDLATVLTQLKDEILLMDGPIVEFDAGEIP